MKKLYFQAVLLIAVTLLNAQTSGPFSSSTFSKKIDCKQFFMNSTMLGDDEKGNVYFMHVNSNQFAKKAYFIDRFDKDMKLVTTKELNYNQNSVNKTEAYLSTFEANHKIYFLTDDESGSKASFKAVQVNTTTLSLEKTGKEVATTDKANRQQWVSHDLISSDDKYALVSCSTPPLGKDRYHVSVFNSDLNIEWQDDIKFPFEKKEYQVNSYAVEPDGHVDFLVETVPGGKMPGSYQSGIDYSKVSWKLLRFKGSDAQAIDLKLKEGYISEASIDISKSGFVLGGFYCTGKGSTTKGVFVLRGDLQTGNISAEGENNLPDGYIYQKLKGRGLMGAAEFWDMYMTGIHVGSDGSVMWAWTQKFPIVHSQETWEKIPDEIVVRIKPDNTLANVARIPKLQFYNPNFVDFPSGSIFYNNEYYMLYLDNPDNANTTDEEQIKDWMEVDRQKACLMLAHVKADGSIEKQMLQPADADVKRMDASSVSGMGKGAFIAWASPTTESFGHKFYQLLKLDLK